MFVGNHRPLKRSDTAPESGQTDPGQGYTPKRRGSWRQAIFNRVVTPHRPPTTPNVPGTVQYRALTDMDAHTCTTFAFQAFITPYPYLNSFGDPNSTRFYTQT